jgi:hypothetical protein
MKCRRYDELEIGILIRQKFQLANQGQQAAKEILTPFKAQTLDATRPGMVPNRVPGRTGSPGEADL